jgi:large subunit ribosomal protein L19
MAMRRRHAGRDTSFRLRNLVGRTGVEVAFKLFSPMVKSINVVQRATNSGPAVMNGAGLEVQRKKPALKAARRAKLYFVRDQPSKLVAVGGIVKQAREKELLAEKKRR